MNWIRKSLANTLAALIAVILLIVFVIITLFSFNYISSKIKEGMRERLYIQSESISKDVTQIFEGAEIYTRQMSMNRDITSYLKEVKNKEDIKNNPRYNYVYDYLKKVKESESLHFLAWVANEKAQFYLDSLGNIPDTSYDVKKRPWYKVARQADGVGFTEPYIEWGAQKTVISSILALEEEESVYGFVVVDIMLDSIPRIIESMELSPEDKTFIITSEGRYMYHEDSSYIVNKSIHDEDDILNPVLNAYQNNNNDLLEVQYNGKGYFLMGYDIEINGWQVITLIDQSNINREIFNIFTVITLMMLTLFAMAVVGIFFIVEKRIEPIKDLVLFAEEIAKGNYEKEIPDDYLDRPDEMGEISKSFKKVTETFKDENIVLEDKVNKINEVLEKQYAYILETEKAASLGNLVAGVAHEINTPLGVGVSTSSYIDKLTHASVERLEQNKMSKEDLIDYFEKVAESTKILNSNLGRAAELVRSFKKIAVDQHSEIKETFHLRNVIDDVIVSLRSEYKRKKHEIVVVCDEDIKLESYPGLFSQLLTNLLMNAIQHGFKHKEAGKVKINCWLDNDFLYIIFEDNGKGVDEETQKIMFEPFYTTNREAGNSGLGMSIIQNIVTQSLDGKIQMESKVNQYTRFTIMIPTK